MTSFAGMETAAVKLVRRYYVYAGVYTLAASVIWGVNTLFLLDAGLSIGEVFIANSAWSAGTVLFEIPTGVVADTVGRRVSFLLSLVVLASATLGYVGLAEVGGGVVAFSIVSVIIGLGFTFYSGAMEAWLVDGVRALGFTGDFDKVFSRGQLVSGAAMLVGTVGGGVLGQVDLSLPFLLRSGLLVLLFVLAFAGMDEIGFEPRRMSLREVPAEAMRMAREGVVFGWGNRSLRLLMLATAAQMGLFSWAWYAWQPYFLELLGEDAVWVAGVVAALLAVSMMVGNGIVEIVTRWCGRRSTVFIWAGAGFSLALVGVGAVTAFVPAVALLFLGGVAIGVQAPVRQAFIHEVVPSGQRATVVSFDSMVTGGGSVVGQTSLGAYSEARGFSAGYIAAGLATIVAIPLHGLLRRQRDDADFFEGFRPEFACATPAVPAISTVAGDVTAERV